MKSSNKKKKNSIKKFFIKLILMLIIVLIVYALYLFIYNANGIKDIFDGVEEAEVLVSEYIVYGTHFNIEGSLEIDTSDIEDVKLSFKTVDNEDLEDMDVVYEITSEGIEFTTSELINEGIDLEEITENNYYMFLKVEYSNETEKYYSLKDNTDYGEDGYVEYYTITKNGKNNKVEIKFANYSLTETKLEYMYINVNPTTLPDDVYDVVIDPGHGGSDVGAVYRQIYRIRIST